MLKCDSSFIEVPLGKKIAPVEIREKVLLRHSRESSGNGHAE